MTKEYQPSVYMIVLNWNGIEHLRYCLPSLVKTDYQNYHILLVDNASTDESIDFVRTNFPIVDIAVNKKNLGWAGGNNVGIKKCMKHKADYILLLNNDILIDPRWIKYAVQTCESDKSIGLLGFDVYGAVEKVPVEKFESASRKFERLAIKNTKDIPGLALFVRRDVFQNVGLIDESYFAYGEDNDFEARVSAAGYKLVEINVPLWHYGEGTSKKIKWKASYLTIRNTLMFAIKNYNFWWILKMIGFVGIMSSLPLMKINRKHSMLRRMRPSWSFVNIWIFIYCLIWNLVRLPTTLRQRREDRTRIMRTRRILSSQVN